MLLCWYPLDSSHWVLSDEYPCARVSVFFRVFASFCFGQISKYTMNTNIWQGLDGFQKSLRRCALNKVASALEGLTLIVLVANLANTKRCKNLENDWNPGIWYSSESTQRELSNEYQHDRVKMVFKNLCVIALWTKVASALEGLMRIGCSESWALFLC